mmetsp:Transcript_41108/g.57254  ORF Transcript_41108/g.57254 Transcript_41108/m.57254 type:complete len:206 (-) Transcript_41108:56-673(-)
MRCNAPRSVTTSAWMMDLALSLDQQSCSIRRTLEPFSLASLARALPLVSTVLLSLKRWMRCKTRALQVSVAKNALLLSSSPLVRTMLTSQRTLPLQAQISVELLRQMISSDGTTSSLLWIPLSLSLPAVSCSLLSIRSLPWWTHVTHCHALRTTMTTPAPLALAQALSLSTLPLTKSTLLSWQPTTMPLAPWRSSWRQTSSSEYA